MRFPESWLRAWCDPDWTTDALAEQLTMAGLEVEETTPAAPPFSRVVVGEVRTVSPHPNADKLRVCEVDTGEGLATIVCGAPNVAAGQRVPTALPGAVLPGGLEIKPVTMRGVQSAGMLCSARELGLSEDHSGLLVLAPDAPVGRDVREVLALDDTVFLLKLTPNRPDCLGVFGIAREVAALSGAPLKTPSFEPVPATIPDRLPVTVAAPDLCGRFSGRVIRGVNARAATPAWMRERLERAGQRSISALVDISNYVMLELARPSHIFDLGKIHGGLEVRWGREGESLELLNGQTITVDGTVGVIADARQVESLAGIMGGEATAVSDDTRDIYVEAAFWWPRAIAGRARRYNFATDAGHRFERGVDPSTTVEHIEYLTRLILEICGGAPGPVDDQVLSLPDRTPVTMRTERARRIIGVPLTDDEMAHQFERLGLSFTREADRFVVVPPPWRFDLRLEEDLIEEVVRLWGFDRLPVRPPKASSPMMEAPEGRRSILAVKRQLAGRDYQEVINFSFVDGRLDAQLAESDPRAPIALLNPIASHLDRMRTTLWSNLVGTLRFNLNRKASRVRLFEVGRVFRADPSVTAGDLTVAGVDQPERIAGLAWGPAAPEQWGLSNRPVDFFDVKADVESLLGPGTLECIPAGHPALHPGRSARLRLSGREIGWLGELHPAVQQALDLAQPPVLFEVDLEVTLARRVPAPGEVSKFPPAIRDVALVVPVAMPAADVRAAIEAALAADPAAGVVKNIKLFDEYRGKGLETKEKSLAFRFLLQDTGRTLSDAEVAAILDRMVAALTRIPGVRLRA